MANEITTVDFKSLSGIDVHLDAETVRNSLVRGNGKVTNQEVAMFLRTCQAKNLDPFEEGEVYLIKYGESSPAQMVVGCHAYIRRADHFPDYRGCRSGITVTRNTDGKLEVIQKDGSCVYKTIGETLIGGWCRVYRERVKGNVEETFVEVALDEYNTNKSNWVSKPATMIQKVAKSQAFRAAFPNEYEGLYTIDEMEASGAIPQVIESTGEVVYVDDDKITQEQRQQMFVKIKEIYPNKDESNAKLKELIGEEGYSTTADITNSAYERIIDKIEQIKLDIENQQSSIIEDEPEF